VTDVGRLIQSLNWLARIARYSAGFGGILGNDEEGTAAHDEGLRATPIIAPHRRHSTDRFNGDLLTLLCFLPYVDNGSRPGDVTNVYWICRKRSTSAKQWRMLSSSVAPRPQHPPHSTHSATQTRTRAVRLYTRLLLLGHPSSAFWSTSSRTRSRRRRVFCRLPSSFSSASVCLMSLYHCNSLTHSLSLSLSLSLSCWMTWRFSRSSSRTSCRIFT